MTDCVFFYGTLLTEFGRCRRAGIDADLTFVGRGSITGALFDVGLYAAAVRTEDGVVRGDVYCAADPASVLARLDDIEGAAPADAVEADASLYTRAVVPVTLDDGRVLEAWVYFYNAPLGQAERIESGDYRQHVRGKQMV
jgi:gamma-glutamylcyclotransferase (GGCT)/AIG2-like uncharacterized protein YtfP